MPLRSKRLLDDFLDLCRIASPSGRESEVARVIIGKLDAIGLSHKTDDAGKGFGGEQGNIIVNVQGSLDNVPTLLLNAHMDTVVPCDGVTPIVRDGVVYSDGTTILGGDDKAGCCVLLELLRVLHEDIIPHGPLEVVFSVAEEIGLQGVQYLDYSLINAEHAFVFDGGTNMAEVIVAAPTHTHLDVNVRGVASHAAVHPERGVNAIALASRAISGMNLGRIDDETTANVGIINGGGATNVVPGEVNIQCEARSHDRGKLNAQVEHMRALFIGEAEARGGSAAVEVYDKYEAYRLNDDAPVLRVARAALAELGLEMEPKIGGGGTDGNIFNNHGISALVVSNGEKNVHQLDECCAVADMEHSVRLGIGLVTKFSEMIGG